MGEQPGRSERRGCCSRRDATCVVYLAPFLGESDRGRRLRRIDSDAPLPYMIFFLAVSGVLLQIQLPLCIRDQDLDGRDGAGSAAFVLAGEGDRSS